MLDDSFEALQETLERVKRYATAVSLHINATKTKVLCAQDSQQRQLFLEGVPLVGIAAFLNLGVKFLTTGQAVQEIDSPISSTRKTFNHLRVAV